MPQIMEQQISDNEDKHIVQSTGKILKKQKIQKR
jgi:hypothetical protein